MNRQKRILIISAEVWRDDTNGGNTLSNLFSGMNAEFAQIYCNPGTPNNMLCKRYFQLTDFMMINNIFKRHPVGKILEYSDYPSRLVLQDEKEEKEEKTFYAFFRTFRLEIFSIAREIFWKIANWQTPELHKFIVDFNPDIIFAPMYGAHYMLRIDRYVAELSGKKLISFISDDHFSFRQFSLSPFFWFNRFLLRQNIKRGFKYCDLVYVMTQSQIDEYKKDISFHAKLLMKAGHFPGETDKTSINRPIRIVFAGNIFYGRWKTLERIGIAIKKINQEGIHILFDIYTQSLITSAMKKRLHDGENIFLHKPVTQAELKNIYHDCDIALHVESFDLQDRLLTRLSFSTKIMDCLQSGRAVMAICWKENAGYQYLKNEDAAICIENYNDIEPTLQRLVNDSDIILRYAAKAWNCGKRNHQLESIQQGIINDFERFIRSKAYEGCTD